MAIALVLSVAETLFAALQRKELRDLCSNNLSYVSQLGNLCGTVETIQNVLLKAESTLLIKGGDGLYWISKLKDAVYEADDLIHELLATIAKRHKRMNIDRGTISKTVRALFSSDNHSRFGSSTFQKIEMIREKLDSVVKDHTQFGFSDVCRPGIVVEIGSYVQEHGIIGRDSDKEVIIGMLLGDSSIGNVSFVSIVGLRGMGKTALAQLVYNDVRIKNSEFDLKLWVCVSGDYSVEVIIRKILKATSEQDRGGLVTEELQKNDSRGIEGIKYFLILDDLWIEGYKERQKLREFLCLGARGSRVLVTTHSYSVAKVMGGDTMYSLRGLPVEYSRRLFERIAFNQGSKQVNDDDALVEDVVRKCENVPLAIRVVGSMLYGQDKSVWELFLRLDLAKMYRSEEGIMPILKFSYCQLTPQLKSCFSYCALFPKDYVIQKEILICLWAAQGFLEPIGDNNNRGIEDVGEEYFLILLQRCFLQDITRDSYGNTSCKMHDLIHDLAREVAGKDSYLMKENSTTPLDENTRHLSIADWRPFLLSPSNDTLSKLIGLRTLLRPSHLRLDCESQIATILAQCRRLRALDLHNLSIQSLPNTMKNLLHLRYLNLSYNKDLEELPKSIYKLLKLQVLNLRGCARLKELPEDLRKLVNLRHLDITGCNSLTHMPIGIDSMTNLCTLTRFVLDWKSSKVGQHIKQLNKDLLPLNKLKGELKIVFKTEYMQNTINNNNEEEGVQVLKNKLIKILTIEEEGANRVISAKIVDKRLLERLEPHRDLRALEIKGYRGFTLLPRWVDTLETSLPYLRIISLQYCQDLTRLPPLNQLQHLKYLTLKDMPHVEFMEKGAISSSASPSFPSLSCLVLENCPRLISFPECPHVEEFYLSGLNTSLKFITQIVDEASTSSSTTSTNIVCTINNSNYNNNLNVKLIVTDSLRLLNSIFGDSLQSVPKLRLHNMKGKIWSIIPEKFACSIQYLSLINFPNLELVLGEGIEHLTSCKGLTIRNCQNLKLEEREYFPWKSLGHQNLRMLCLGEFPQLNFLPSGIQRLTSLTSLQIVHCKNLISLPEWLSCLKFLRSLNVRGCQKLLWLPETILPSLTLLDIVDCDNLKKKYSAPYGENWPKISHIPSLYL